MRVARLIASLMLFLSTAVFANAEEPPTGGEFMRSYRLEAWTPPNTAATTAFVERQPNLPRVEASAAPQPRCPVRVILASPYASR